MFFVSDLITFLKLKEGNLIFKIVRHIFLQKKNNRIFN